MNPRDSTAVNVAEYEDKVQAKDTYELIRKVNNACEYKKIEQLQSLPQLKTKWPIEDLTPEIFATKESKDNFRNHIIAELLKEFSNYFQDDKNEMLFCSAAQFDSEKLEEIIKHFQSNNPKSLNQVKFSDSAIVFALKYGNIFKENMVECMKKMIEAPIDLNLIDIKGKSAIDYIALLYETSETNTLIEVAKLILEKGVFEIEDTRTKDTLTKKMKIDMDLYTFCKMDDKTKLFFWIIKNKTEEFVNFPKISKYVNCDNSENTLLQFACKKTDNMLPIVQCLLRRRADPNKTTDENKLTPLELAAIQNNQHIFEELLKHRKTQIDQKQFTNFVRWRAKPMKPKLFEILLESDKLDPTLTYEKTGNTPLHYAIYFSHKKAIQNLLKRNSSILPRNSKEKRIIDMIDASDLQTYFDSCLAFDNYTPYFTDYNYKMKFRFNCLIDNESNREIKVIANIGKQPNLEHLLTHPLIHIFISLKWFNTQKYFWIILFLQALMYVFLSVFFYRYPETTMFEEVSGVILSLINIIVKILIFLNFTKNEDGVSFPTIEQATFHSFVELFLIITMFGSFFQNQFRAFIFTTMAISFLLTAGYHPRLSKWSIMLQKVFKTFTILLIFFSFIIISFSVGFHIVFKDADMFRNMTHAVLATYVMTVGEFNSDDIPFESQGVGGYLLFFLFAMSVSLVIVNFWTGVAVSDIERIEKNSEINAFKNVIIFMLFIDYIYTKIYNYSRSRALFTKHIPKPLLFLCMENDDSENGTQLYQVDFFPNKDKQFGGLKNLPRILGADCFNKLEQYHYRKQSTSSEERILAKLEAISKTVRELKDKLNVNMRQTQSTSVENKFKKKTQSFDKNKK